MKILLLGSKGLLGYDLCQVFKDYELICLDKEELDITDATKVKEKIKSINPQVVINSTGYTAVDACESCKDLAMDVNANGPKFLALVCKDIGAILVHFSTDYVFDGSNKQGYFENNKKNPINSYGDTKSKGEDNVLLNNPQTYIIRTSWLYGKNGNNFVFAMLKLCNEYKELTVVNDQFGRPTYAKDLALTTKYILENKMPFGIYHATNDTQDLGITWYDFAKKIFEIKKINVNVVPVTSEQFPRPASRPKHSVLQNSKLPKSRNWQEALQEFLLIENI